MKKISLYILLIFTFFFILDLNVYAKVVGSWQGAPLYGIIDNISKETFEMYEKDQVCVYKSSGNGGTSDAKYNYVVIYFEYIKDGDIPGYLITDVTPELGDNYRKAYTSNNYEYFMVDAGGRNDVKVYNGTIKGNHWWNPKESINYSIYTGSDITSFCNSMQIEFVGPGVTVNYVPKKSDDDNDDLMTASYVDWEHKNDKDPDGNSVAMVYAAIANKERKTSEQKEGCSIKTSDNVIDAFATLKWDDNLGWHLTFGRDSNVCFGKSDGYNNIVLDESVSKPFDSNGNKKEFNLVCENYKVVTPVTNDFPECDFFFVNKDDKDVSDDITTSTHSPGSRLAVYALYGNTGSSSITIYKTEKGLDVEGKTNLNDKVTNIANAEILSKFQSGNKDNYPIWINAITDGKNNTTYQFSDKKIDGANNQNYINVDKILDVVGLGEGEVYKTCRELFTTDFLEFLNNTIFRVLYIGIPILLIVLTTFDFAKVVFIDDKEGIKTAGKRFGKRIIVAILIYLIPTLLIFIGNLMGASEIEDCAKTLQQISNANKAS